MGHLGLAAALLLPICANASPRIGDTYEIVLTRVSQTQGKGSSGDSHDKDTIVEKVTGLRADGVELEYDLPKAASQDDKDGNWQFPARVFKPSSGPMQLLNRPELEARVEAWLKEAGVPRSACGHWIFTWNAFRIECDPQSAIDAIAAFDLGSPDLRDGAPYRDPQAQAPAPLRKGADGTTFAADMQVDPDAVRRARAESDVAVGEILKKPVTLEAALQARAKETVTGTISVSFETDATGTPYRRTKVVTLASEEPDGRSETMTVTETLERRLVSRGD